MYIVIQAFLSLACILSLNMLSAAQNISISVPLSKEGFRNLSQYVLINEIKASNMLIQDTVIVIGLQMTRKFPKWQMDQRNTNKFQGCYREV